MEENVEAPLIRRHVSRMKGVLALGKFGDATFESSYPLAGSLADLSESLAKFGDEERHEERHQALCALLHLLPSEAAGDLVPQIVSILEADVFEGSPPAELSLQRQRVAYWSCGQSTNRGERTAMSDYLDEAIDADQPAYEATKADLEKLRKVNRTLYKQMPPVTGATVAGLRCINVGPEGIDEPVETGIYCCWSDQPQTEPPPSGGAVPPASYIQAVVFVCEMEFESEVPDELLSSLRVAYEVRSAADSTVVLSEEGAEVTLAVNREDGVYDAVLLAGSGVLTADDGTFLGRHLQCTSLQTEKSIADFCESSSETRCFVLFEGVSEELKQKVHGQEVPVICMGGGAVDLQLCLRSVLAHCVGGRETIESEIKERCVRDGESNLPIVASAAIDVMDPFDECQTLVDKVIVTAQYRIPQLLSLPAPSDTPRELSVVKGPSPEQAHVAEALLRRTRAMFGSAFGTFKDVQFLITVPNFTTLLAQTASRVRTAGLLDLNESEYSKVITNWHVGSSPLHFNTFKEKALKDDSTLFVIIADECHFGPTSTGAQSKFINDPALCDRSNVVVLLNSATPFNCMTERSRLELPAASTAWCDPLSLGPDEVPESNVVRWRPNGRGRYRHIDFFIDSIAFQVPKPPPTANLPVADTSGGALPMDVDGQEARWSLLFAFEGGSLPVEEAEALRVELFPESDRFGSMKPVAEHISKQLKEKLLPLQCKYSVQKGRFLFEAAPPFKERKGQQVSLRDDTGGRMLRLLGFTSSQNLTLVLKKGEQLVADEPTTIDDEHPVARQLVRSDTSLSKLHKGLIGEFGTRKSKKRSESRVGVLLENGNRMPISIQDGHLIMSDYLVSLAYFALVRVNEHWHVAGSKMLLSFEESEQKLRDISSLRLPGAAEPLSFTRILETLARSEEGRQPKRGGKGKELKSYDMRPVLIDFVYKQLLERARREWGALDEAALLSLIFEQKLTGEKEAASSTDEDSWFTETDRNVLALLDQSRDGEGCIWGQMVMIRVYENQENMTMQTILRDALDKLGLARPQGVRAFSILSDISETVIHEGVEPYFFKDHDLRRAFGDGGAPGQWGYGPAGDVTKLSEPLTLDGILERKRNSMDPTDPRAKKVELGYSDLHNLPMLLIVTEKARMGDTFPHSLVSLDLRLRTGGTLAGFTQELGRMCRYPSTRKIGSISGLEGSLSLPDSPVKSAVDWAFGHGLPVIVMPALGRDIDIIAHAVNWAELAKATRKSAGEFELHVYFDRLPRALIRQDVQKLLVDGINVKETQASNSDQTSTLQCVLMERGIDDYMKVKGKGSAKTLRKKIGADSNPLHEYWSNYVPGADKGSDKAVHYDELNPQKIKHPRRLLLFAECQIGKTGAYLHYLTRLRDEVRVDPTPDPVILVGPIDEERSWRFPYWQQLSEPNLDYSQPKLGHYYVAIARERMSKLQELAGAPDTGADWGEQYCAWLRSESGEFIVSKAGLDKIQRLRETLSGKELPVKQSGEAIPEHATTLRACTDWDGRMTNLQQLQQMGEMQQPGFRAASAVWKMTEMPAVGQKTPAITGSAVLAGPTPPPRNVADRGQIEERSICVAAADFDEGAALSEAFDCKLFIPHRLRSRVTHDGKHNSDGLKVRWMFTCSYGGAQKATIRLNREPVMAPLRSDEYVQVLVLRDEQASLDAYLREWGSEYIIAVMPRTMEVRYACDSAVRTLHDKVGGIGYARLFCQLLANELGLEQIWMLDDNVERCWRIDVDADGLPKTADGVVQLVESNFTTVMRGVELIVDSGDESTVEMSPEPFSFEVSKERDERGCMALANSSTANVVGGQPSDDEQLTTVQQYAGGRHAFGVIGMQRNDPRNRLRQKEGFSSTHSVYSFYLLNIKASLERGVLYPSKAIWEDIEFLHALSEAKLAVCKVNRFIHQKRHLRPPPTPPPVPTPLASILRPCTQLCGRWDAFVYAADLQLGWLKGVEELLTACSENDARTALVVLQVPSLASRRGAQQAERGISIQSVWSRLVGFAKEQGVDKIRLLMQPPSDPTDNDLLHGVEGLSAAWIARQGGSLSVAQHKNREYLVVMIPCDAAAGGGGGGGTTVATNAEGGPEAQSGQRRADHEMGRIVREKVAGGGGSGATGSVPQPAPSAAAPRSWAASLLGSLGARASSLVSGGLSGGGGSSATGDGAAPGGSGGAGPLASRTPNAPSGAAGKRPAAPAPAPLAKRKATSLAYNDDNKVAIAKAGGIAPLVALVRGGTDRQKHYAAVALARLAWNADNKVAIARAGGIAPLVALARDGTDGQKEGAAAALMKLAANADNHVAIAKEGGIAPLVALARDGTDKQKEWATWALWCLSWNETNLAAMKDLGYGMKSFFGGWTVPQGGRRFAQI